MPPGQSSSPLVQIYLVPKLAVQNPLAISKHKPTQFRTLSVFISRSSSASSSCVLSTSAAARARPASSMLCALSSGTSTKQSPMWYLRVEYTRRASRHLRYQLVLVGKLKLVDRILNILEHELHHDALAADTRPLRPTCCCFSSCVRCVCRPNSFEKVFIRSWSSHVTGTDASSLRASWPSQRWTVVRAFYGYHAGRGSRFLCSLPSFIGTNYIECGRNRT